MGGKGTGAAARMEGGTPGDETTNGAAVEAAVCLVDRTMTTATGTDRLQGDIGTTTGTTVGTHEATVDAGVRARLVDGEKLCV